MLSLTICVEICATLVFFKCACYNIDMRTKVKERSDYVEDFRFGILLCCVCNSVIQVVCGLSDLAY
jgi:hypothetical protein